MNCFIKKSIGVLVLSLVLTQNLAFGFKLFGKDKDKDSSDNISTDSTNKTTSIQLSGQTSKDSNEEISPRFSFARAVAKAEPAVVSIQTTKEMPANLHPLFQDPFLKFFFNDPNKQGEIKELPKQLQSGLGSGVIVNKKGYVLTNNHVIKDAKSISVKLPDGRTSDATIIGADPKTDLAVLKINNLKDLPEITLGSSEDIKVGDVVLAIGNPLGFARTVTLGIVSATGSVQQRLANGNGRLEGFSESLDNLIQTDASINPGNSGGALIDSNGHLVGINMAIITNKYDASNIGIGFAIPIDLAKTIMQQLIETGHIVRGWLGAYLGDLNDEVKKYLNYKEKHGVYVSGVFRNSPAQKAGLLPGDIIIKINGKEATNISTALNIVYNLSPKKAYPFEVFRKGEFVTFSVVVTERPKENN